MGLIKNSVEIEKIRKAGEILRKTKELLVKESKVGVTPLELDKIAENFIRTQGGEPGFLNYQPQGGERYPATICASRNEVVVHCIPDNVPLKSGDVFSIDLGVKYQGYNSDSAVTVGIGKISKEAKNLIKVTKESLEKALKVTKPGNTLGDIGYAVSSFVKSRGFYVVKGLTGHGIGQELHEEPVVFNEGDRGQGMKLEEGMVLAIEPMVSIGTPEIKRQDDGSYAIADGSLSAHFEHTIVITKKGNQILT